MSLTDLLISVEPVRDRLRLSHNPESENVELLLDASTRHVAVARFGVDLFNDPNPVASLADRATAQKGALLLVFAGGRASIDLCASALLRWHGLVPQPERQHDFTYLRNATGRIRLADNERSWYEAINQSNRGTDLTAFRDATVHRVVRQDTAVVIGGEHSTYLSPFLAVPGSEEAREQLDGLATFVEERWSEFWRSFAS
jgi:hypothetical protein